MLSAGRGNGSILGGSGNDTVQYDQRGFADGSDLGVWVSLRTGTAHHLSDPRVCDTLSSIENVEGTPFRDIIFGNDQANVLDGGIGRDVIYGGGGDDTVLGGPDSKVLHGGSGNDYVEGGTEDDRLYGDGGSDTLDAGIGDDILYASGRAGTRESARSDNYLDGGIGKDTFVAGHGYDEMSGASTTTPSVGGRSPTRRSAPTGSPTSPRARIGSTCRASTRTRRPRQTTPSSSGGPRHPLRIPGRSPTR